MTSVFRCMRFLPPRSSSAFLCYQLFNMWGHVFYLLSSIFDWGGCFYRMLQDVYKFRGSYFDVFASLSFILVVSLSLTTVLYTFQSVIDVWSLVVVIWVANEVVILIMLGVWSEKWTQLGLMSVYEGRFLKLQRSPAGLVFCLRPLASSLVFRLIVVCSFVLGWFFLILALLLFSVVIPIACFCCWSHLRLWMSSLKCGKFFRIGLLWDGVSVVSILRLLLCRLTGHWFLFM